MHVNLGRSMTSSVRQSRHLSTQCQILASLPTTMSQATITTIQATAPVVAPMALDIVKVFYREILKE